MLTESENPAAVVTTRVRKMNLVDGESKFRRSKIKKENSLTLADRSDSLKLPVTRLELIWEQQKDEYLPKNWEQCKKKGTEEKMICTENGRKGKQDGIWKLIVRVAPELALFNSPVSWSRWIQWLLLYRWVRLLYRVSWYDIKKTDDEGPVMLELWGMQSTFLLPSLRGPLWLGVIAPDKVLPMG